MLYKTSSRACAIAPPACRSAEALFFQAQLRSLSAIHGVRLHDYASTFDPRGAVVWLVEAALRIRDGASLRLLCWCRKAKNSFLATRQQGVVGSASAHAANFPMIPPSPKRHKRMEEMEVRWQSAPRPRPTDGWLMNKYIYSAPGSASLQRGPGEPPGSTSHNHTSGSSGSSAEPWTTLLFAPRAEGGVHDSVVTLGKDDIFPRQWHPPPGTKIGGTKDQWRPGCYWPQPSCRQQHWPPDQASRARQAPTMYLVRAMTNLPPHSTNTAWKSNAGKLNDILYP
jgi:hypothetical protein